MNISKTNHVTILGLILALTAFAAPQQALADGDSASATGDAKAKLIAPLTLTNQTAIDFGKLIKNFSSGTESVTLVPGFVEQGTPNGTISSSDNSKLMIFGGHNDGDFQLGGEGGESIQISAPAAVELSKDGVPSPTDQQKLVLSDLLFRVNRTTAPETVANGGSFVLEADGATNIDTGGTLTVEGDDETGSYSGSYTVTVAYQ